MIDWVKMLVNTENGVNRLLQSPSLDFTEEYSIRTGEVTAYPKKAQNKGFEFVVSSPKYAIVTGSLHKYYYKGQNYNDFTYNQLVSSIDTFCNSYGLYAGELILQNLEFGVNINTYIPATDILKQVICFKNRVPIKPIDNVSGYFIEFGMEGYYFKLYDKAKQYKLKDNLLRLEVKATKSRVFTSLGIRTLADLQIKENLIALSGKFFIVHKGLVYDDDIDVLKLSTADRAVYDKLVNPREWVKQVGCKNSTHRARERRFKGVVRDRGKYGHYEAIKALSAEKWRMLVSK